MGTILGLDISTSEIGMCLQDENTGEIIQLKSLSLNKMLKLKSGDAKTSTGTLIKKVQLFDDEINMMRLRFVIKHIFIEDFLRAYSFGRTSKATLIALAQFNGMAQLALSKYDIPFSTIPVATARKLAIGKMPTKKQSGGLNQKEFVFQWFKKNVTEVPDVKNAKDMVDAWVICTGGRKSLSKK